MKKRNQDARIGQDRGWEELSLDKMCERWNDSHSKAIELQATSPDSILFVNYDQQVHDPAQTYAYIATFIGLPNLFDISKIKPRKAKKFLSDSEVAYVKDKTKDIAKEFSYAL